MKVDRGGWFLPNVKVGDIVSEGDIVGRLYDLMGGFKETEALKAPRDGVVRSLARSPVVWPGERVATVDSIIEEIINP